MKTSKRLLSVLLVVSMLLGMIPTAVFAASSAHPFEDVPADLWCNEAVQYVYDNRLMNGTAPTRFEPNGLTTRSMLVTVLYRMEGSPAVSGVGFGDVEAGSWYEAAVLWAQANNIVNGYSADTFAPNDPITREQMATVFFRYVAYKGYDVSARSQLSDFTDGIDVSAWAADAMSWAVAVGLIQGVGNALLAYQSDATRAQIATILMRFEEDVKPELPPATICSITFEPNGGSGVEGQTVGSGMLVQEPEAPVRDGYSFAGWYQDAELTVAFDFSQAVHEDLTLYAKWELVPEDYCKVRFVPVLSDEYLDNPEQFSDVTVLKGTAMAVPEDPCSELAHFLGWYADLEATTPFDFAQILTEDTIIYAKWELNTDDTDGDGAYDWLENQLGTDPEKADSDGDGLKDFVESLIGTDPLAADTDSDGVNDYAEDSEGDGLTNGFEVESGTKPEHSDSDQDGLTDGEEVDTYGTDPLKEDTDGDGASDFWEVANGFDPLTAEESFAVSASSEAVTEYNLTSATVSLKASGEQADTLDVQRVGFADNSLVRSTLPGYMGSAYDFSVDGSFEEATITFCYNTDVYGAPDEDFQPRIYYLDEEKGYYVELENQSVENGSVSVTVTHFSTYILLNKIQFDLVWESEIRPPDDTGATVVRSLDVVFVIDYSASMDDNDPDQLFKQVCKEFVAKLRDGIDRAAVVKFIRRATLVSGLTTDKDALNTAIDSIRYDSGWGLYSGTDGSTGIYSALEQLSSSEAGYQYIVFITDGEDNGHTYSYDDLIASAVEAGVNIYTIGMGSASETVLRQVADGTGGKYYHATTSDDVEDVLKLEEVLGEIESETIEYTTDSNDDGISDYYTRLIYEGRMPMADHLKGVDLSKNDDFDGDGLKNGEEIQVVVAGDQVYLKSLSNPALKHSDSDGEDDFVEVQRGSNPLTHTEFSFIMDSVLNEVWFYAPTDDEPWLFVFLNDVVALTNGILNRSDLYMDIMSDYFVNYTKEDYMENIVHQAERDAMVETLMQALSWCDQFKGSHLDKKGLVENIWKMIDKLYGLDINWDIDYKTYETIMETVVEVLPENTFKIYTKQVTHTKLNTVRMDKVGSAANVVFDGITYAVAAQDVLGTIRNFSAVSANNIAFEDNLDILQWVIDYSADPDAVTAAKDIKSQLEGDYLAQVDAVLMDVAENAVNIIVDKILASSPYGLAVLVVRDTFAILTGIQTDLKQRFQMMSYTELARASTGLYWTVAYDDGTHVEAVREGTEIESHLKRYLTHIIQTRILGEQMYCAWHKYDGILPKDVILDYDEMAKNRTEHLLFYAELLGVSVDISLYS